MRCARQDLTVLPKIAEEVKRLRFGSQHIVVAHVNAADGFIDLPTSLSKVIPMSELAATLEPNGSLFKVGGKMGMQFVRQPDGSVLHQRSPQGRSLNLKMAAAGMLPCMGVSEHIRPSTCQKCKKECEV